MSLPSQRAASVQPVPESPELELAAAPELDPEPPLELLAAPDDVPELPPGDPLEPFPAPSGSDPTQAAVDTSPQATIKNPAPTPRVCITPC